MAEEKGEGDLKRGERFEVFEGAASSTEVGGIVNLIVIEIYLREFLGDLDMLNGIFDVTERKRENIIYPASDVMRYQVEFQRFEAGADA